MKKVAFRQWAVKDVFGEKIYPGSNRLMSMLEALMLMFPDEQFNEMIR